MSSTPEQILAKHGKSFRWAGRLLGRRELARAARLYAFCREVDDLVDEGGAEGQAELVVLRQDLSQADGPAEAEHATAREFLLLAEECAMPVEAGLALVDTCQSDAGPVRLRSLGELLRYAYGVAGVVGLLMCGALGLARARQRRAAPFAIDLGLAMQLTNIARDVLEDAERDRVYLPAAAGELEPEEIAAGEQIVRWRAYSQAVALLDRAERYYASAERGLRYLPWRPRLAILVAGRVYRAIGSVIRRRGPQGYWRSRCYVGAWGKLWITARAAWDFVWDTKFRDWGAEPVHDPRLHVDLLGLPGADDGARTPAATAPSPEPVPARAEWVAA